MVTNKRALAEEGGDNFIKFIYFNNPGCGSSSKVVLFCHVFKWSYNKVKLDLNDLQNCFSQVKKQKQEDVKPYI